MKKIASFEVDHENLQKGIYISRIDSDIVTYDLRMRIPNNEEVLENDAIHTLEHLFATFVRNSKFADNIIYFGPMGCRTGFYFLTRGMNHKDAIDLTKEALAFIADFKGEVPGVSAKECGNFKEHSLDKAKNEAKFYLESLKDWKEENLKY